MQRDFSLGQGNDRASFSSLGLNRFRRWRQHQFGVQNFQPPAPEHGQHPVRGHAAKGLVVVKVIAELGVVGMVFILAADQLGRKQPFAPEPLAQRLHQRRVFGPALAQNVAHAVQHRLHGGEVVARLVLFSFDISGGFVSGHQRRVGKQRVCQRLNASFAGDLAFGAAFCFVGQVQVFQILLGGGLLDGGAQLRRELALLFDAFENGLATLLQLAQVAQPVFQLAQLNIVQPAGSFLAVARNERHGRAAVEQLHCRFDLILLGLDVSGDLANNFLHGK